MAYLVTLHYLRRDYFLSTAEWIYDEARASVFPTEESALTALEKAREGMRNKHPRRARVILSRAAGSTSPMPPRVKAA